MLKTTKYEGNKQSFALIFKRKTNEKGLKTLSFNDNDKIKVKTPIFKKKTNENGLKTLSFNDKDKIKGKVNSTMFDFLV
ncbi:hypothetical protein DVH24_021141 [Malus domestica]|uniref:Uncharacterized protein n=1 Tax=Malus domestica TaxID=3750 RepID=A0A498J8V5_MALDO|nr:hypothetical protein DVH24_021141 [Malus domestica]